MSFFNFLKNQFESWVAWIKPEEIKVSNQGFFDAREKVIISTTNEIKIDGHVLREEIQKREIEKFGEGKKIIFEVKRTIDDRTYKFIHSGVVGDSCNLEEETSMTPNQRDVFMDMWDDLSTKARELTTFNKFASKIDEIDQIDEHKMPEPGTPGCPWFDDYANN